MTATQRIRARGVLVPALVVGLVVPGALSGQSLLSAYGFGSPLEAMDARSLALGGVGMGLIGTDLASHDPAAASDLFVPAVLFTSQTSWVDVTEGDQASTQTTTRFPSIGIMYPLRRVGTATLSFTGVLDQTWNVSQQRLLTLEGTGTQARVTDAFESRGGVSALRLGLARRVTPRLAVGATVGTYLGNVTRVFTRSFDSLEVETDVPEYQIGGAWDYSGFTATVGATLDVEGVARIAGSFSLGGDLEASPTSDTDGSGLTVGMPTELRLGGTALLSDRLRLNAGVVYADWTDAARDIQEVDGNSVFRLGGDLEWTGASILGKSSSLRLGYRRGDLPFHRQGDPKVKESAFSGGVGMNLLESENVLLARADFGVERGSRDAGSFKEEFWRLSVTLRLSGF